MVMLDTNNCTLTPLMKKAFIFSRSLEMSEIHRQLAAGRFISQVKKLQFTLLRQKYQTVPLRTVGGQIDVLRTVD